MNAPPAVVDLRGLEGDLRGVEAALAPLGPHLRSGGLVAYPTETVYGLGGAVTEEAVSALGALKGREEGKPFLLVAAEAAALEALEWTGTARELAEVFWPGSLTLVLADPRERFPGAVRGPGGGVAVRVPGHPVARELARLAGGLITSTSANEPGKPPALDAEGAAAAVGALGGDDVWIVDAGPLPPSPPSTIVDCTGDTVRLIREGTLPLHRLRCVRPEIHGS